MSLQVATTTGSRLVGELKTGRYNIMDGEDDSKWGDSGETHDVMCATTLSTVYGIEIQEVQRRISAAELRVIGEKMVELLRTGADMPDDAMARTR